MTVLRTLLLLTLVLAPTGAPGASELTFTLDPARTTVGFTLKATGHEVQGAFAARPSALRFDPASGEASGDLVIDLRGAKTGNSSRDATMHDEVLETPRHPLAVFHARRLDGTLAPAGTSDVSLEGMLTFHGAEHPMTLPARITVDGTRLLAELDFDVPYVAWGLHDPSFLFLRVAKVAKVHVRTEGELSAPLPAAR